MKLHYYPETDSLYIELKNTPRAQVREIVEGLVIDLDADGNVVGLGYSTTRRASSNCRAWKQLRCLLRRRPRDFRKVPVAAHPPPPRSESVAGRGTMRSMVEGASGPRHLSPLTPLPPSFASRRCGDTRNRAIETAKVIEELIQLAKDMKKAEQRGVELGLTDDEVAFYDALETNDSAVKVLGDDALRTIARELVGTVRANVTIDWTVRENVQAHLRVLVKRILRKYG